MNDQRQIFSLKQVVLSIRKTIEERYQSMYWVKAEMHKLNMYPSGHAFPELVQKEDGKIVAQINGALWKHQLQRINEQFVKVLNEPLKEGTTLLMQVKITYSEMYGMSLQILDIDPSYVLGELQRERQETLLQLQKEGLLKKNQELSFPLLPKRIAIISADSSKGLSDFMKVINQNVFGYRFFTHLFPAYLQGDVAVDSIVNQLIKIESVKEFFDIVVIVRGGGGEVGLSCYNNYKLCKAIANSSLPVLTGIGHSTNLTVAEMIAYRNAITPTELGEFLIQSFHDFNIPVEKAVEKIKNLSNLLLERTNNQFNNTVRLLKSTVQMNLTNHHNLWQMLSRKLNSKSDLAIQRQHERIGFVQQKLNSSAVRFCQEQQVFLSDTETFLKQNVKNLLLKKSDKLEILEKQVAILNPINVLKRGYSISKLNGKTINSSNQPTIGDSIEIETYDLTIKTKVDEVISEKK